MTLGKVIISEETIRTALLVLAILGVGVGWGYQMHDLTTEIRLMRQDICRYAVPETERRFTYSCRDLRGTLQAQERP